MDDLSLEFLAQCLNIDLSGLNIENLQQENEVQNIRTRILNRKLSYAKLARSSAILNIKKRTKGKIPTRRHLKWVSKNSCQDIFGFISEYVIRKMISKIKPVDHGDTDMLIFSEDFWQSYIDPNIEYSVILRDLIYNINTLYFGGTKYMPTDDEISKTITLFNKFEQDVILRWTNMIGNSVIEFNKVLEYEGIEGHPDIVIGNSIIDVKTTGYWDNMSADTALQILTYVSLYRRMGYTPENVGVYLPMQQMLIWFDVSSWDDNKFWNKLIEARDDSNRYKKAELLAKDDRIKLHQMGVGSHFSIGSRKRFYDSIVKYFSHFGTNTGQIYLRGNGSGGGGRPSYPKTELTKKLVKDVGNFIRQNNMRVYIHGLLPLNPSYPEKEWQLPHVKYDLETGTQMSCKGVVIHVGKHVKKKSVEDAVNGMEIYIRALLPFATEQCPIILETPVGAGTELLTTKEELLNFYLRFYTDENIDNRKFRICVDTCHVFAAGHDPLEYLQYWVEFQTINNLPYNPIKVIHFNDSAREQGCRVDRHADFGTGLIGKDKLIQVAELAYTMGIDMVKEECGDR